MVKSIPDTKPNKEFTEITQTGLKAYQLANQYSAQLSPRLDAALLPAMAANLAALGEVIPSAIGAQQTAKQSTAAQNDHLAEGLAMVTAARLSVGRQAATKSIKAAYGVGSKTSKTVVKEVVNALQKIADRIAAQPDEAKAFGLLPDDIAVYKTKITEIQDADKAQEQARAIAPLSTKQRNRVAHQVLAAVDAIAGAGVLAFATSATERASFEALVKKV